MTDEADRLKALDPTQSFIVQAPAGSGKTELLTQRFLKLLAHVEKAPEEILAVTFTRKAAAQMRQRIVNALMLANQSMPCAEHEKTTWLLAQKVLARDRKNNWELQQYPNRLRILTIDALSAFIANRMPVLSHLGASAEIVEVPQAFYRKAVERLLSETTLQENWANALRQLLLHLDNRIHIVSQLLQDLLSKRDQWLIHLNKLNLAFSIEDYLNAIIEKMVGNYLQQLDVQWDEESKAVLLSLVQYAKSNVTEDNPIAWCNNAQFPSPLPENLSQWLGIAELLLTKDNAWRKSISIKQGFLSPSDSQNKAEKAQRKVQKESITALIGHLSENETLRELLAEIRSLPLVQISQTQKNILNALSELLPVLVAHLQVIFQEKGKIDFIEVSLRALQALGDELTPSDISLSLDYQINHILIDEYQDTSHIQYHLFEKLVMGWQSGDGKTLFLVGDPMQSIYRFRGAEVSLFLKTQQQGLGNVELVPISLQKNFRSCADIIQWTNKAFSQLFPSLNNQSLGGVSYKPALAVNPAISQSGVFFHPTSHHRQSVALISQIITNIMTAFPQERIGVLVRAKTHLAKIILVLRSLRIPFVALDIEHLANRPHVMDLMSLLKAVIDWSDSLAWFAILRAPWLGLTLADLLAIAQHDATNVTWKTLCEYQQIKGLSLNAKQRLNRFVQVMQFWLANFGRQTLPTFLRGLWVALNGPQCYQDPNFLSDIDKALLLIAEFSQGHRLSNLDELEQRLGDLYVDIAPAAMDAKIQVNVELMTIHKAKGLEFDTVIMPHLQASVVNHDKSLLLWHEYVHDEGVDLLLAPCPALTDEVDGLYRFVDKQIRKKMEFEAVRLLYVGVTRAKKRLHLIAECEQDDNNQFKQGSRASFLGMLWPHLEIQALTAENQEIHNIETDNQKIKRLKQDVWVDVVEKQLAKEMMAPIANNINIPPKEEGIYRIAGKVFHRLMQQIYVPNKTMDLAIITLALKRAGLSHENLKMAALLVKQALDNVLNCPVGRWIISEHKAHHAEWALSKKNAKEVENLIIDYTFIDNNDVRWIVDYKLTHHQHLTETVLQMEVEKYKSQMEKYANAVTLLENRPVRCGLYFPMAKVWVEVT
ncbi:MAG: UvrD-helicase domain-containing protein [Proteobacteria bacterium]|nr:UvrD-helicase domain-containing protein [Pseudomonadota bacterium]